MEAKDDGIKRKRSDNEYTNKKKKKKWTPQTNLSKYCHTHGACSHSSKDCKSKKEGHKDAATYEKWEAIKDTVKI